MSGATLDLFRTGHCRHPERSVRADGSWRSAVFPMFAAVIERAGERCVFDPGYAPRFRDATRPFPDRFYRWLTPTETPPASALYRQLGALGVSASVDTVVVSHFHADHVAGLLDFPRARIVCSRTAFQHFISRSGLSAVSSGYLKRLSPLDLADRIVFMEDLPRAPVASDLSPIEETRDLFGDGSVRLVPLPGHSTGQIGAVVTCHDGATRFLVADATWSVDALERNALPPWITRRLLGDPVAYVQTWKTLRALAARNHEMVLIPSHCTVAADRHGVMG